MNCRMRWGAAATLGSLVWAGTAWGGPEWVEPMNMDAGSTPDFAQQTKGGVISRVSGNLDGQLGLKAGSGDFEDVFLVRIDNVSDFLVSTDFDFNGNSDFTSALYLFDAQGLGLVGNIFSSSGPPIATATGKGGNSTLTAFPNDGSPAPDIVEGQQYLIAISCSLNEPVNDLGPIFDFSGSDEVSGADGAGSGVAFTGWEFQSFGPPPGEVFCDGSYQMTTDGISAAIPAGGCCLVEGGVSGGCLDLLTPAECAAEGGIYLGDGVPCGECVVNDTCEQAVGPLELGSTSFGTTSGAGFDDVGFCGTGNTAPGVWYTVVGIGGTMAASTCFETDYDSKVSVFCGPCDDLVCVGGNDDFCGLQSQVVWCSEAGALYRILVHGFASNTGSFSLTIGGTPGDCGETIDCGDVCGDVDGNGVVNPDDIQAFLDALGSSTGDPNYNGAADYDPDGFIGFIDYGIFFECYVAAVSENLTPINTRVTPMGRRSASPAHNLR